MIWLSSTRKSDVIPRLSVIAWLPLTGTVECWLSEGTRVLISPAVVCLWNIVEVSVSVVLLALVISSIGSFAVDVWPFRFCVGASLGPTVECSSPLSVSLVVETDDSVNVVVRLMKRRDVVDLVDGCRDVDSAERFRTFKLSHCICSIMFLAYKVDDV